MVQLDLINMMWSMQSMLNTFKSPPDFNYYGIGGNSTAIQPYFLNNTWGGPSFITWAENGMSIATDEFIET